MTFSRYWEGKCAWNSGLFDLDAQFKISSNSFRKELQKVYDIGYEAGKEVGASSNTGPYFDFLKVMGCR